ncbi:MAG: hypothetical protein U5R06_01470 [candidate division KSB1 bacterium]|nr:hypothetical protein [candidate division KSB1 bacterium]
MRFFILTLFFLLVVTTYQLQAADPVLDLIEQGKNAYQQKDFKQAHDLLQQALGKINEKLSASFKPFLPEAPAGWTGEEADSRSMSFSAPDGNVRVTEAKQRFVNDAGTQTVQVTITNTPEILKPYQQMAQAMQAPMMKEMMDQQGVVKTENRAGWYIIVEETSSDTFKLTAVHEKVVVVISGADSEETSRKFLRNIDLRKLARHT